MSLPENHKFTPTSSSNQDSLLSNSVPSFPNNDHTELKECFLQRTFEDLDGHVSRLASDDNITIIIDSKERDPSMMLAKARQYFKNQAFSTIANMKHGLEANELYQLLPSSYIRQVVEQTKDSLTEGFEEITKKITESAAANQNAERSLNDSSVKIKKTNRKGKNKIPKRAIVVLKNWLTQHFQDPYPSYNEKVLLAKEAGITQKQVQNWFTNVRGRAWRKTCNEEAFTLQISQRLAENERQKLKSKTASSVNNERFSMIQLPNTNMAVSVPGMEVHYK